KTGAYGPFQLLPSTSRDFGLDPKNVRAGARQFLSDGFTAGKNGNRGAIYYAQQAPLTVGGIVSAVEGSDQGGSFYDPYLDEAKEILAEFGGAGIDVTTDD